MSRLAAGCSYRPLGVFHCISRCITLPLLLFSFEALILIPSLITLLRPLNNQQAQASRKRDRRYRQKQRVPGVVAGRLQARPAFASLLSVCSSALVSFASTSRHLTSPGGLVFCSSLAAGELGSGGIQPWIPLARRIMKRPSSLPLTPHAHLSVSVSPP